jgi:hypothetical protein
MTEEKGEVVRSGKVWFDVLALIAMMVCVWLLSAWGVIALYGRWPDSPGTFGDMFGAINALFSAAALAALVYAIFLQHKELELQRQELQNSTRELANQSKALSSQVETMREQLNAQKRREERLAKPVLTFTSCYMENEYYYFQVSNLGGCVWDVTAEPVQREISVSLSRPDMFNTSSTQQLEIRMKGEGRMPVNVSFYVRYTDSRGIRGEQKFVTVADGESEVRPKLVPPDVLNE